MDDIVKHKNILDKTLLDLVDTLTTPVESFFDHPEGVFKGAETSRHQWFSKDTELGSELIDRLTQLDFFKGSKVDGMQVANMIKPYDVHSDYVVTHRQKPISDPNVSIPAYTIIIPLVSGDNKTVIFDQQADYNDFHAYKKNNTRIDPIPKHTWDELCGHCHDEDRHFLSIKQVVQWSQNELFAFKRLYFHSSANFEIPKKAIVVWSSK